MFRIIPSVVAVVLAVLTVPIAAHSSEAVATAVESAPTAGPVVVARTAAEVALVDHALARFDRAGLALPSELRIEFVDDPARCAGYGGVYLPAEIIVRLCRPSQRTLLHELAHAWVETTLDATQRQAFLELRGLDTWVDGPAWDGRGAEHAAEIVMWALLDDDPSVAWIAQADGVATRTTRLFKIPNSSFGELVVAYKQLTGEDPQRRLEQGPIDTQSDSDFSTGGV